MALGFMDGYDLIVTAFKQNNEDRTFNRWLQGYEREMGFEEFKRKLEEGSEQNKNREIDKSLSEEDILGEQESILNQFRG